MKEIFRGFSDLIALPFYCIAIWGFIRHIKVSRELKKQDDTETVREETLGEFKVATRLILIGTITPIVFRIIEVIRIVIRDGII